MYAVVEEKHFKSPISFVVASEEMCIKVSLLVSSFRH
jgi:hypothetical protein